MDVEVYEWNIYSDDYQDIQEKLEQTIQKGYSGKYGEVVSMNVIIPTDRVFKYEYEIIFVTKSTCNSKVEKYD